MTRPDSYNGRGWHPPLLSFQRGADTNDASVSAPNLTRASRHHPRPPYDKEVCLGIGENTENWERFSGKFSRVQNHLQFVAVYASTIKLMGLNCLPFPSFLLFSKMRTIAR